MKNENLKKNGWKIAFIVVVVIAVIGICAALVVPSLLKEEKPTEPEKKEEKKDEPLTKDSKVVQDLFEFFREDKEDFDYIIASEEDMSNLYKNYYTMKSISNDKFETKKCSSLNVVFLTANDTSGEYLSAACGDPNIYYNLIDNEGNWKSGHFPTQEEYKKEFTDTDTTLVLKESDYKAQFTKYFGVANYKKESFASSPLTYWYYDENMDSYLDFTFGGGIEIWDTLKSQTLTDIEVNGNELKLITTATTSFDDKPTLTITYTFEKEEQTGNYIWVSREEV